MFFLLTKTLFTLNFFPQSQLNLSTKIKYLVIGLIMFSTALISLIGLLNIYEIQSLFIHVADYERFMLTTMFLLFTTFMFSRRKNKTPFPFITFIFLNPFLGLKSKDVSKNFKKLYDIFKENNREDILEKTYNELLKIERKDYAGIQLANLENFFYFVKDSTVQKKNNTLNQNIYDELKKNTICPNQLEQNFSFFKKEIEK